jgi:NADH:ubiquinone oxidoreductase subunit H
MVTMMSYELPLGAIVLAFAWKAADLGLTYPFALSTLSANPIWSLVGPVGAAGAVMLLIALILVTPGELAKMPFDAPEAKSEIADGLLVEYSGRNFALFTLSISTKMVVMAALIMALFFPYTLSPLFGLTNTVAVWTVNIIFDIIKILIIMFFSMTLMRVAVARLRITHIVSLYWKWGGALTVGGLLLLMLDSVL